jgi:MFS family permease
VVGTLVVARRVVVRLRSIVGGAAAFGAALLLLGCTPSLTVGYALAALVGGTSVAYLTATTAYVQLQSRRDMVGRVLALQTVLQLGTTPIGGPLLGFVADVLGGRSPVLIGGIAALVAAAFGLPALRRSPT